MQGPAPPSSPPVNSTILYIGNLHWWTTDAAVEAAVTEYGTVVSCRFLEDRATGKSKGVAVIEFSDSDAARKCKSEFTGKELDGRAVVCTWAAPGMFAHHRGAGRGSFAVQQHFAGIQQHQIAMQPQQPQQDRGGGRGAWMGPAVAAAAAPGAMGTFAGRGNGRGSVMMANGRGRGRMPGAFGGMPGAESMNPAAMGHMAGGFGGMNPAMMTMMMAQMIGRGMMGPAGYAGMGAMAPGAMAGPAAMMGAGGFMGGDDEQDFKRQRR
eukprot:GHRR01017531.1.p2 GENE.GHRR01017531.1~~GHRR01017531.1.p2  ORF type:complete len:266 (+),score=91.03 GHRR01017531.1:164-961(+)